MQRNRTAVEESEVGELVGKVGAAAEEKGWM